MTRGQIDSSLSQVQSSAIPLNILLDISDVSRPHMAVLAALITVLHYKICLLPISHAPYLNLLNSYDVAFGNIWKT